MGVLNAGEVVGCKDEDAFYQTKPNPVGATVIVFWSPNGFAFDQFIVDIIK